MLMRHWVMVLIVAVVFYYVGAKYPALVSRMGM